MTAATFIRALARRAAGREPLPPRSGSFVALILIVAVLNVIGAVMVLSASSVQALREYGSSWVFFKKQVLWALAGAAACFALLRVDYRRWRELGVPLLAASVVLLALVLVPGVGITVSGSSRWLGAGPLRMQPSELAKFAVLVVIADVLARRSGKMADLHLTLKPVLVVAGVIGGLVMLQPDMGTTLSLGCIVFAVLFVAGVPLRPMAGLLVAAAAGSFVLGMVEPYRRARMMAFLDPWADAGNTGYQIVQSLVGLGSGGLVGVGLGASRAKWGFLPNAHTDFIFTIIGEELGLIGTLAVVGLFVAFTFLGVRTAVRSPDRFGMLLASGITAWVSGQAFINIGAVIGILPVTGVPLPFVSSGGSSLVITMAAMGILLNIARQSRPPRPDRSARVPAH